CAETAGRERNRVAQAAPCPRTSRKVPFLRGNAFSRLRSNISQTLRRDPCCRSDRKTPSPVRSSKIRSRAGTCWNFRRGTSDRRCKLLIAPERKLQLRVGHSR